MKKLTIIWIVVMVGLTLALLFIGLTILDKKKPYIALENDIIEAMQVYYGEEENMKKLPSKNKVSKITIGQLESFGIDVDNIINGDVCEGYGIVKRTSTSYTYKSYIKCSNYTTKNYSS